MAHRVKVQPVKIREWDAELQCVRARIVGYRAECSCGDRSGVKRSVDVLRVWRLEHNPYVPQTHKR